MSAEKKRCLIINADDFGANEATNRAIAELFASNLISSASVLTVAGHSQQACKLAADSDLPVGVHLTLNSDSADEPWYPNSKAPSLGGESGLWFEQKRLALRAKSSEVTTELEAQYSYMVEHGIKPDHADSHCGTLYGINGRLFFINAFRFCSKYSLPFRFPRSPDFIGRQLDRQVPKVIKLFHKMIVKCGDRHGVKMPDDIISNPYSIKRIKNYENLRNFYLEEIKNLKPGVSEIFLHPAYNIDTVTEQDNEWLKREFELRLLKSGDLLEAAEKNKIAICSWATRPL